MHWTFFGYNTLEIVLILIHCVQSKWTSDMFVEGCYLSMKNNPAYF